MAFGWKQKKQVVLYSMDADADNAVYAALRQTRGIATRKVLTLDPAKVAKIVLNRKNIPNHIAHSQQILRRDMTGKTPCHFITLVQEPRNILGQAHDWFADEYLPATGIDVNADGFDHAEQSRVYGLGIHKLLLLSAHAPVGTQVHIISDFLGRKILPLREHYVLRTASAWSKAGAIEKPLALLQSAGIKHILTGRLEAQARLWRQDYPFTPRAKPSYVPRQNSVLYNAHQALPFHGSGYATRTHGLVGALCRQDWDARIVTRMGYPGYAAANNTVDDIFYIYDVRDGHSQRDMDVGTYLDKSADYLACHAKAMQARVIHTASNYINGIAGIEAARRLGVPSIYEMRGLWHVTRWSREPDFCESDKFKQAQKLELEAARAADHVLAITGTLKDWLVAHGIAAAKISVAPNAVDTTHFAPALRLPMYDGKIVIGYFGSFTHYEGLDLLLEAIAATPALQTRVHLLWAGDGPALVGLQEQAKALGIAYLITATGRLSFADMPRLYAMTDIAVYPRRGLPVCEIISPLKPFEAMASGKAILVSDVLPLQEIVEHGVTGLTHKKDDAQDLAAQLLRLVEDKDLRDACGAAARDWVCQTRTWDGIAKNIGAIYRGLV